ncbi:MAG TPA: peptidoglycan DD-metalloendopeptidase family protein [Pseudolabrys sp.]|nr:peptidoglycan DD-metalloendopeptidase family protein [Pseudolabrys sp.]
MPRFIVPLRSQVWPRVAVLVLLGASVAACSDSARVNNFDFGTRTSQAPAPQQEVTGSVTPRPAPTGQVWSQPLPAPSRPATVAPGGVSYGAEGLGAYRPPAATPEYTGSVTQRVAAAPPPPPPPAPPPQPAGHWTWDGGKPVTVERGQTVQSIAHKYGVPAAAILETNGIKSAYAVRPGQRLVIPRYVSQSAPRPQPYAPPPRATTAYEPPRHEPPRHEPVREAPRAQVAANVHVVQPGETLIGIARRYGISHAELARANHIQVYAKLSAGDRITIPGNARRPVASREKQPAPAQQQMVMRQPPLAQPVYPRAAPPIERVDSIPAQNARMVTPAPPAPEPVAKSAEPAGGMPAFRWPVKGRIIAGFGQRPNGTQNDGINLAVPEGTPIKAAEDGVVAYAGNELKGYGNLVLIRHSNGFVSAYANASSLTVKRGDAVKRGQVIAHAGQTGNVTSPQLHFEIRKGSTPVDPTKYLGG